MNRLIFRIFFFRKIIKSRNNIKHLLNNKDNVNVFFFIIKFIFRTNLKLKASNMLLKSFSILFNYIFQNDVKNDHGKNYSYYLFFKKSASLNRWLLNLNSVLSWIILNYELLFFFKKKTKLIKKNDNSSTDKNKFSFFFLIKKKRKKILFKWIKNKLNYILKENFFLKILNLFLELILNFKRSNFFKFKNLVYRTIIQK